MSKRYHQLVALKRRQEGQTMAEYSVVLTVITFAALTAFSLLATNVTSPLSRVAGFIS